MPWTKRLRIVEGPLVLIAVSAALLVYGLAEEDILSLGKSTLPAVALLAVFFFSLIDFVLTSRNDEIAARLAEYEAISEGPITPIEILAAAILSTLFTFAMLHVGVVVTTTIVIALMSWYLDSRISVLYGCIALIVSASIWLVFEKGGGVYLGNPILF